MNSSLCFDPEEIISGWYIIQELSVLGNTPSVVYFYFWNKSELWKRRIKHATQVCAQILMTALREDVDHVPEL